VRCRPATPARRPPKDFSRNSKSLFGRRTNTQGALPWVFVILGSRMVFLIKGLKERGQGTVTDEDGEHRHSTFTCAHCNTIHFVPVRAAPEDLGGLCKLCMGLTCPKCTGGACDPFEEKLRRMEHRAAVHKDMGLE